MPSTTVFVPVEPARPDPVAPGMEVVRFATVEDFASALSSGDGPVVLVSDGLTRADITAIAEAVSRSSRIVIEVRSERWDGQTVSELSAACRGVISGFGFDGIGAGLALLEREAASAS